MDNLIKCLIIEIIVEIFIIVVSIIFLIKIRKDIKSFITCTVIISLILVSLVSQCVPIYKDIIYKKTVSFEGVFVLDDSGIYNLPLGSCYRYFDLGSDGEEDNYFLDTFLNTGKYVPQKGKKYRVIVYKYSHTIYSLELIE